MTKGELAFAALEQWCKTNGYPVPVPEYPFAKALKRRHRFDAAWVELKLGLDIQGQIWKKGGHTTGGGISKDCEKYCLAATLGWRVMPMTYPQFNGGQAYGWLETIFTEGR